MRKQNREQTESVSECTEEELQTNQGRKCEDEELDREISESLRTMIGEIQVPSGEHAWALMSQRLNVTKQLQLKRSRRRKFISAAASIVVAVSLSIGGLVTSASFSDFYRMVKIAGDGVVHYVIEKPGSKSVQSGPSTGGDDDQSGNDSWIENNNSESKPNIEQIVSMDKALQQLAYEPLLPTYVPERYKLDQVKVVPDPLSRGNGMLRMEFLNEQNELVYFQQQPIDKEGSRTPFTIYDGAGDAEVVVIGDYEGILLTKAGGGTSLKWSQNELYLHVSGEWTKEEMLEFAHNLN